MILRKKNNQTFAKFDNVEIFEINLAKMKLKFEKNGKTYNRKIYFNKREKKFYFLDEFRIFLGKRLYITDLFSFEREGTRNYIILKEQNYKLERIL